jgi:hypothetical protein
VAAEPRAAAPRADTLACLGRHHGALKELGTSPSVARFGMAKRADYEPMTLGNMRQFGMSRLSVSGMGPIAGIVPTLTCRAMPTT